MYMEAFFHRNIEANNIMHLQVIQLGPAFLAENTKDF